MSDVVKYEEPKPALQALLQVADQVAPVIVKQEPQPEPQPQPQPRITFPTFLQDVTVDHWYAPVPSARVAKYKAIQRLCKPSKRVRQ